MTDATDTLRLLRRGDLAGARALRLPDGLDALPPEVFGLADTLEVLDLGRGGMADLPAGMGRLGELRVLFGSNHRFRRLPPALGDCPALSQIGFRGNDMAEVPDEALPPRLRWLTLTDNALPELPAALGRRPRLQKLMLAGNRLTALPEDLAGAPGLELLRVAANRFEALPGWLAALPSLAWVGWAGNPHEAALPPPPATAVPWSALDLGAALGEGASGRVQAARWRGADGTRPVAVKLFKGAMTSDGLPEREMAACLAAGEHPGLAGALGRLVGHPGGADGLVMPLLPEGWRPLAGPPSPDSCTRDVYDPTLRLTAGAALGIAHAVAGGTAHLHARGILHGDLYAHNVLWDGSEGRAALTDFGAASALPDGGGRDAWMRVEVRAFGLLLGELLDRADEAPPTLRALERACTGPMADRPAMAEVAAALHGAADAWPS